MSSELTHPRISPLARPNPLLSAAVCSFYHLPKFGAARRYFLRALRLDLRLLAPGWLWLVSKSFLPQRVVRRLRQDGAARH